MRFELFLAIRYLRQPKRRLLTRLTALAAIFGIGCGVAALIFALALSNGFRREMQDKILHGNQHITIFRADNEEITNWKNLGERIEALENVKTIAAVASENVLLIGKANSSYAVLRGSENFKSENKNTKTEDRRPETVKIEIGKVLAEKTGLKAGERAKIVAPSGFSSGAAVTPISTMAEIGGVFETGLYEYDLTWIRLSLSDAAKIAGKGFPSASALAIETADIYSADRTARKIREVLGAEYKVLDWQEANRPLFAALALERRIALIIIGLIVLIAALNITTTLTLLVNEHRDDIAVLKSCGAGSKRIVLIFLSAGLILGAIGILIGILLGLTACFVSNRFHLIELSADVYSISRLTLEPQTSEILLIVFGAISLSLMATIIPAFAASRIRPLDILKN